jgi:hypothetical protein
MYLMSPSNPGQHGFIIIDSASERPLHDQPACPGELSPNIHSLVTMVGGTYASVTPHRTHGEDLYIA